MISFKDIITDGDILETTNRYIHYQTLHKIIQYDSNKIVYKIMPDLHTFKKDEQMLKALHDQHKQPFLKFVFPENERLEEPLSSYLTYRGYEYSWIELYVVTPQKLLKEPHDDIEVMPTDEDNIVDFLNISYEFDKKFGTDYAELKVEDNKKQFNSDNPIQVISYYKGKPAGILLMWDNEAYVELDSFTVREPMRRLGIGSQMQSFVANYAKGKSVILVADGEDTAKDMYKAQGYQYGGFQYEALKEFTVE